MKRRTTICREGWYYLLVFGFVVTGSILREINLLLVVAGMMLFPFLLNWRATVTALRGVTVRRRLPSVIAVGETAVVEIELQKGVTRWGSRAAWAVRVEETVRLETGDDDPGDEDKARRRVAAPSDRCRTMSAFCWRITPNERQRLTFRAKFHRRGRYCFGATQLSTRFPLGLVQRTVRIATFDRMIVYPQRGHLTRNWMRLNQVAHEGVGANRSQPGILEGDFHSLRDWRQGDSRRRIHWRTSARRGSLVVRQFEQRQNQDLALLLDLWQPSQPGADDGAAVERAIRFAATVVYDLCQGGNGKVMLGTAGQELRFSEGPASPSLLHEMLEQLALAEATDQDHRAALVDRAMEQLRPGMTLLLVSPRSSEGTDLDHDLGGLLSNDDQRRRVAGRAIPLEVNTSGSDGLSEYFVDANED